MASFTSFRPGPETVASRRTPEAFESYALKSTGKVLAEGRAVGEKIATGKVRLIESKRDLRAFKPGEVLVAPATSPDWEPVMKIAAAIVTDHGGRTCHAAIVARELGRAGGGRRREFHREGQNGWLVTVSCADGDIGHVYDGKLPFEVERISGGQAGTGHAPPSWSISAIRKSPSRPRCCPMMASVLPGWNSSSASTSACTRWRWRAR